MSESGGANLAPVRPVAAIGDQVDGELAFRRLDRGIGLPRRHVIALGVEFEVVNERFHRGLHVGAPGWRDLVVLDHDRAFGHLLDALADDPQRLAHLLHAHQVSIVAIAVLADRNIEIHPVVDRVGLRFSEIPGGTGGAQDRTRKAPVDRLLGGNHADIDVALFPDPVFGQ